MTDTIPHAILGVDPGVRGGIAVLSGAGAVLHVKAIDPSMTQKALVQMVTDAVCVLVHNRGYEGFCEKVGYMPGDGGKGANTFGRIDGLLRGALLALGVTLHDVSPMIWQSRLNCMSGGNKNITKQRAAWLFRDSGIKITHSIADALLIAEFGRRITQERI